MIQNPFRYFKTSREVIQLAVMMYVRFPLSGRRFSLSHASLHKDEDEQKLSLSPDSNLSHRL
ncbi:hypothetical protein GCM10009069_29670 [Algimonas arctica]|uniref:Uncharacterized protein n=1 Tax=Algimonas arctica TaxID=1479486 RepID=A0A8J3G3R7_9PROT|nr:hypothetical protein GCM10009069_29670 [Algimonas arctica]